MGAFPICPYMLSRWRYGFARILPSYMLNTSWYARLLDACVVVVALSQLKHDRDGDALCLEPTPNFALC
jgi:hypothetical protein